MSPAINFRLTDEEKEQLEIIAENRSMSLSQYIRYRLLESPIIEEDFTQKELKALQHDAKRNNLSLKDHIKCQLFKSEDKAVSHIKDTYSIRFLNKNLPMMTRVLIDGYYHIRALARQKLKKSDYADIVKEDFDVFNKLGITKKEEE